VSHNPFRRARVSRADGLIRSVANAEEGNRNSALFWAARRCVEEGHDPMLLAPAALGAGLSQAEVDGTLRSALRYRSGP